MTPRSLLLDTLRFSLPLALVLGVLEWKMRTVPNTYAMKARVLAETADSTRVLVLGASHELNGVRPLQLGCPTVNLANGGQSLELDGELALTSAERLPRLQLVIFGISYFSFASRLSESTESWREGFYYHYFGVHESRPSIRLPQLSDYSVAALYDPAQTMIALRTPSPGSVADRGWFATVDPGGRRLLGDDRAAAARVAVHESATASARQLELDHARRAGTIRRMQDVVRRLEARHVAVVFISSPTYAAYRRHLRPATLRLNDANLALVRGDRPYFDYTSDPRFGRDDFANFDHLTADGATKFTAILSREVVGPVLPCAL